MEKDAFFNAMLFYSNLFYGKLAHFNNSLFEKSIFYQKLASWPSRD